MKASTSMKKNTEGSLWRVTPSVFCVPSMVVSLNQRRRGGYLTATIQIPSWLPSWAALYQSTFLRGIPHSRKSKKMYPHVCKTNFRFVSFTEEARSNGVNARLSRWFSALIEKAFCSKSGSFALQKGENPDRNLLELKYHLNVWHRRRVYSPTS